MSEARGQVLRGFAERERDGSWFMICIDLNLYARGDSFEEAKRKLDRYIDEYLEAACGSDREHLHQLLPRRAPLYFILKYHLYRIIAQLQKKRQRPLNGDHRPFRRRFAYPGC